MNTMEAKTAAGAPVLKAVPTTDYNRPSLPFLLSEYGFEDEAAVRRKKLAESERRKKEEREREEKQKSRKKVKRKTDSFDDAEDEKELEREKEKDEYYLQMVRDLYRLRDYYYNEYSNLLSNKVQQQRKKIRERDEQMNRKKELLEEEERKASHRVKKRLERHTLDTTPVTVAVPKTDIYHIVGLEQKLRREGKLKTVTDYNKFWEDIEQPHIFNAHFKKNKNNDFNRSIGSDYASTVSHRDSNSNEIFSLAPDPPERGLDHSFRRPQRILGSISELHESSRPGTRTENWAVTQQYPAMFKSRRSIGGQAQAGKTKSDYMSDLDKRFPKLEMPKLHCFTMNLNKKPPDPEEVLQQEALREREKQRKRMARTVTKMYQLAMTNAATSARILDGHEDIDMILDGPALCDVIGDHHWMEAYGLHQVEIVTPEEEQPPVEQTPALPEIPSREGSAGIQSNSSGSHSREGSGKSKKSSEREVKAPIPLTISEVEDNCGIKEATGLSTLWNNYLRAGKNK